MIDAIAELFFLSDRSDHNDCSDHLENGLKLLHKQLIFFLFGFKLHHLSLHSWP